METRVASIPGRVWGLETGCAGRTAPWTIGLSLGLARYLCEGPEVDWRGAIAEGVSMKWKEERIEEQCVIANAWATSERV